MQSMRLPSPGSLRSGVRWAGAVSVSLLLSACTTLSLSTADALRLGSFGSSDDEPTPEAVAASPYYQAMATTSAGSAVLILGNLDGAREAWYSASQEAVFIEHGRVVKTAGLPQNLDALRVGGQDPFVAGLHRLSGPVEYRRQEDWSPNYRYGVEVTARLVPAGEETVRILGTAHRLLRVDERISAPAARYEAQNRYWVDPSDGFVWKSRQSILAGTTIELVQLKPYRGGAL